MYCTLVTREHLPLRPISIQQAIVMYFLDKVEIIEEWDYEIRSPSTTIKAPKKVAIKRHVNLPAHFYGPAPLTDRGLRLRDDNTCQYCGVKESKKTGKLEWEHVVPKSRGGKDSWKNVVLACRPCNQKKDNMTPEEAKMPLLAKPWAPTRVELDALLVERRTRKVNKKKRKK